MMIRRPFSSSCFLLRPILVLFLMGASFLPAAELPQLPAGPVFGDIGENAILGLSVTDRVTFENVLAKDLARFLESASRLERISANAFRSGSFLDRLSQEKTIVPPQETIRIGKFWKAYLREIETLDLFCEKYHRGWKDKVTSSIHTGLEGYLLGITAKLCRLVNVSKLCHFTRKREKLARIFNEGNQQLGLPKGALDSVALRSVKPREIYSLYEYHLIHTDEMKEFYAGKGESKPACDSGHRMKAYLNAHKSLLDNLLQKIAGDSTWYKFAFGKLGTDFMTLVAPVQETVFTWVGDAKLKRRNKNLITPEQVEKMEEALQPGDIFLERRNWFLSDIFLPGFWPHGAIYIGPPEKLRKAFDGDPETCAYFRSKGSENFSAFLKKHHPDWWKKYLAPNPIDQRPNAVMEAISDGVVFSSAEEAMCADYIAVMRPRLPRVEIAKALVTGFSYLGTPYDFNFDFWTEQELVCTEFVSKSYAEGPGKKGLTFNMTVSMGKKVLRADNIVQKYVAERNTEDRQLDFAYFLMGREKAGDAVVAKEADFVGTSKWKGGLVGPL